LAARFEPLFTKWTELAGINCEVATAWENKLRVVSATQNAIRHRIFYAMLPDHADYQPLLATLREVVEERWGCQLLLAGDRHYGENMLDNVRAHLEQASAFIAEVTAADPTRCALRRAMVYAEYLDECWECTWRQAEIQGREERLNEIVEVVQ